MTIITLCTVLIVTITIASASIAASIILKRIQSFDEHLLVLTEQQISTSQSEQQLLLKNFFHVLENLAHTYALEIRECEKNEDFDRCVSLLESQKKVRKAQNIINAQLNIIQ